MDTHPVWLKRSKIPLTIVCGPPCAGKTTYVTMMAEKNDVVIDLDLIRQKINPAFQSWSSLQHDRELLTRAIRIRNMMLANLSKRNTGCAWFIIGAPAPKERIWWQAKLGGEVVVLNPGIPECMRRAYARGTPLAADGVSLWSVNSERDWHPPKHRRSIGADGWFADEDVDEADVELSKALSLHLPHSRRIVG